MAAVPAAETVVVTQVVAPEAAREEATVEVMVEMARVVLRVGETEAMMVD